MAFESLTPKVGDRLVVCHRGTPVSMPQVTKVFQKVFDTSDGRRWNFEGDIVPKQKWSTWDIRPERDGDRLVLLKQRVRARMDKVDVDKLSEDDAVAVYNLISSILKKQDGAEK